MKFALYADPDGGEPIAVAEEDALAARVRAAERRLAESAAKRTAKQTKKRTDRANEVRQQRERALAAANGASRMARDLDDARRLIERLRADLRDALEQRDRLVASLSAKDEEIARITQWKEHYFRLFEEEVRKRRLP